MTLYDLHTDKAKCYLYKLCFLLLYLFMTKAWDHKKSINTCFNEINSLIKKIKAAISVEWDV